MTSRTPAISCLSILAWLSNTPSEGSVCHTIADGAFDNEAVWDCGCDPYSCDTLIIQHVLTADAIIVLANDLIHITAAGSLVLLDQVSVFAELRNEGSIEALRLYQTQTAGTLTNHGTITVDEALIWGDSALNMGAIHAATLFQTGLGTRVMNYGRMDGHYLEANVLYNYDTLSFDSASLNFAQDNLGFAEFHNTITVLGMWTNEESGTLTADTAIIWHTLHNRGLVIANDLLQFGNDTMAGSELDDFPSTARILCRHLKNYGHIQGLGDICIQDSSINYSTGLIDQTPDICDATLAAAEEPFIDLNFGVVTGSVNWCAQTSCATGLNDAHSFDEAVDVYPVPAMAEVFFKLASWRTVSTIRLTDLKGAIHVRGLTGQDGIVHVARGELASGVYQAELFNADGERLGSAQVVFIFP